jgi:hypothetical protein
MNQGVTANETRLLELGERRLTAAVIEELVRESALLRDAVEPAFRGLDSQIVVGDGGPLAHKYEAGNILAPPYRVNDLPDEIALRGDLNRFLASYKPVLEARDLVLVEQPGDLQVPARGRPSRSRRRRPEELRSFDQRLQATTSPLRHCARAAATSHPEA